MWKESLILQSTVLCPECRQVLQQMSKLKQPLAVIPKPVYHDWSYWLQCLNTNCTNQRRYSLPKIEMEAVEFSDAAKF